MGQLAFPQHTRRGTDAKCDPYSRTWRWQVCFCRHAPSRPAKAELKTGYNAFQSQDYDDALADAEKFLQHTPTAPVPPRHIIWKAVSTQTGTGARRGSDAAKTNLDAARTAYTRALTVPSAPKVQALVYAGLANIAYHVDDYGTAVREWQVSYAAIEPLEAKAWVLYRIGVCQQRLGWFPQADRSLVGPHEFPRLRTRSACRPA